MHVGSSDVSRRRRRRAARGGGPGGTRVPEAPLERPLLPGSGHARACVLRGKTERVGLLNLGERLRGGLISVINI